MKRFLFCCLVLAVTFGFTASVDAYFVDSPHNESNGIYCYMCHNNSAWYWGDPNNGTGDIDVTIKNYVCLSCHGPSPDTGDSWVREAPIKSLHASSTTSTAKGTWSTECTDCHDPHVQPQLDWANTDAADFWLAEGFFDYTFGESPTFSSGDPDGQGYGATTIGISFVTGQVGWDSPLTWASKGGLIDETRAVDVSRGLVLVPNKGAPTETFEIIKAIDLGAGNYRLKVKGQMTSAQEFVTFGVFYGQSLKASVVNPLTLLENPVKYFKPAIIDGTYGGWIDDTPATSAPQGICQVCHAITSYWNYDGTNPTHNDTTNCSTCHDVLVGGSGGADHATKIINHYDAVTYNPNIIDCSTCHDPADPAGLHTDAVNISAGTGCEACHDPGQTQLNADVAARLGVTPAFGDDGAWPYDCSACHPTHPAAVDAGTHGGHPAGSFGWNEAVDNCDDCHSATPGAPTEEVVFDIHGNTCTICHDPAQVAVNNYTVRIEGDPTFGIDGDARGATNSYTCTDCHNVNTPAVIHHDSKNGYAAANNCTICHTGTHSGDHSTAVTAVTLCSNCHAATGNTVNSGDDTVHDSCVACHNNTDGSLVDPASSPLVTAMPAGGAATNDGGGNCSVCHTTYFDSHIHGHGLQAVVLCQGCHTATAAPFAGAGDVHGTSGCATCHHTATSGFLIGSAAGKLGNENCQDCHAGYFDNHSHSHSMSTVALCLGCHMATTAPYTTASEAHGTNGCGNCHDLAADGALKGSAVGKIGGDCVNCHATYFDGHDHGVVNAIDLGTVEHAIANEAPCDGCHNSGGSGPDAINPPYITTGEAHNTSGCGTCHDLANGGAPLGSATAWGLSWNSRASGTCKTCHTAYFDGHGHDHSGSVVVNSTGNPNTVNCTGCHAAPAGNGPFTGTGEVHNPSSCSTCHDVGSDGSLRVGANGDASVADGGIALDGALECGECHAAYFNGHIHHTALNNDVSFDALFDMTVSSVACNICHGIDGPDSAVFVLDTWGEIFALHSNNCMRCHDYDGTNGTWNNTPLADVTTALTSGSPVTCIACHTLKNGPATHGGHTPADWDYVIIANDCKDCHGDGGQGTISGVHSGNCALCHTNPGSGDYTRIVGSGGDGDATLAVDRTGDCLVCHPSGIYSKTSIHHDTVNATANPTNNCTTACHNTSTGHAGNHTTLVSEVAPCLSCHAAAKGSVDNVPVDGTPGNTLHDYCTSCHVNPVNDIIDLVAPGGYVTTMNPGTAATNDGGGNCSTCHTTYFNAHGHDHSTSVTTVTLCTSCHTATTAPFDGAGEVHNGSGCLTCHSAVDGSAVGSRLNSALGGDCQACHTGYFDNHGHSHAASVTTVALCLSCHTATTAPFDGAGEVHNGSGCLTCHSAATGAAVGSRLNSVNGGDCQACHNTYFDGHGHAHLFGANVLQTPITSDCDGCHTATATPFTGAGEVHNGSGCLTCHSAANGSRVGSANGNDGATECISCHSTYFTGHTVHTASAGHTILRRAGDTDGNNTCETCHGLGGTANPTKFTNAWDGSANDIFNLHTGSCNLCHDSGRTTDTTGAGVQDIIQTGGAVGCLDCHTDRGVLHAGHPNTHFSATATCTTTCHVVPASGIVTGIHSDTCTMCHDNAGGGTGTTIDGANGWGDARLGVSAAPHAGVECSTCHTAYFDGHTHDHSASVTTVALCANCHTATTAPFDGVGEVHNGSGCLTCHDAADGSAVGSRLNSVNGGDCQSCHTGYFDNHGHAHTMPTVALCTSCHTASAAPYTGGGQAHNASSCSTCHNSGTGALQGSAIGATGGENCQVCHTGYFDNHGHSHAASVTTVAMCLNCHAATTAPFDGVGEVHNGSGCLTCHDAADGSAVGSRLNSVNGGNCQACHTGYFDNHGHAHTMPTVALCTSCHTASAAPYTGVGQAHNASGCFTCHNAGTGALMGSASGAFGGENCTACHTGYFDNHTHNHAASVIVPSNSTDPHTQNCLTSGCHTATTSPFETGSQVHVAGTYAAGGCLTCHAAANGALINGTVGDATGTTGECSQCHSAFASHLTHTSSNHSVGINGDTADGTSCNNSCHGSFSDTWNGGTGDIFALHLSSCDTCHNTTTSVDGDNVQTVIQTGGTVSCLDCHSARNVSHGGHAATDFQWQAAAGSSNSCGASLNGVGCHDDSTTDNVVTVIHNGDWATGYGNTCQNCHTTSGGGDGTARAGLNGDGDATLASTTIHNEVCTDCHTGLLPAIHHDRTEATGGQCLTCHAPDVGQTGADNLRSNLAMPANMACNWCHIWWPNNKGWMAAGTDSGYDNSGTGGTINISGLAWAPNGQAVAGSTVLTSHAVSTNTTTPISDYAACFACHGADTSKGGGFQVTPFHGLGTAVTNFEPLSGDSGTTDVLIQYYAGPVSTGQNQVLRNEAFHPGFGSIGYLGPDIVPVTGTKQFSTDTRKAHDADQGVWDSGAPCNDLNSAAVAVPWDGYSATVTGTTGTSATLNTGGQAGSFTKSTIMPTVPLSIPTNVAP